MNAITSQFSKKQLIVLLSGLLFLFVTVYTTNAQLTTPGNINTWKPTHLSGVPGDNPYTAVKTDFTITMRDGVIIDCLKWIPDAPAPVGGWPTVIMVHGYGDHKGTLSEFCRLQAEYGYYTMTFSVRGQGNSGGLSNLISRTEAMDLQEIVNFVRKDTLNGVGKDKILIMGGSQGGALPLMAASMPGGLPVKGIINSVAPPDFASSWIENGCVKMTLLWTVEYTQDTARYNGQVNRMSDWIYAENKQYWDSLAYWLPRDRDFTSILQNNTVPLLVEASWQDKFFNADGWLQNIHRINSPMSSYMGAVQGHGGEHSATEDIWHMDWFNNFFFQTLWGMQTPIFDQAKYQYAYTHFPVVDNQYFSFTHDSSSTLLRTSTVPMKLYLNKNGVLKTTAQTGSNTVVLKNKITNGYTLQQAVNDEFTGSNFTSKFKKDSVKFLSSALTTALEWTGTPIVRLDYKSAAQTFCQFNYQIYEVLPNGSRRFINRPNFTDRNYTKDQRRQVTFRGQAHSHKFQAGSKILIIITNLDKAHTDVEFFGTNPFVLPTMKNGDHTVYLSSNSYVELPIMSNTGHRFDLAFEQDNSGLNTPNTFSLSQNFPNPFNPSTMIQYSIADAQHVELKVYDLLGREVQTLVNELQNPGSYNVNFNAVNLSSGIYFYKISAGSFSDIRKMTLVK